METTSSRYSIIMPVYNVAKYLDAAIDSVLSQTYNDWELILVNDASLDDSLLICYKYAKFDKRIIVVDKHINEGLGMARNTGMEYANGEWILFIDSDDRIEPYTLERLQSYLEKDAIDVLVFGFSQEYEDKDGNIINKNILIPPQSTSENLCEVAALVACLDYTRVLSYVWNKLYRCELIKKNNIKFERTKMIEDILFNFQVFNVASHVSCIPESYYRYRKPLHETLASQYINDFHLLCLRRFHEELSLLARNNALTNRNLEMLSTVHIKHIFSALVRIISNQKFSTYTKLEKQKEILNDKNIQESLMKCTAENFKYKVLLNCMKQKRIVLCFILARIYLLARNRKYGKIT